MPLPNRKLISDINEFRTHDTTHGAEAAYQISNHSNQWLLSFSRQKYTYVWTMVKLNAPDAYWRGHKYIIYI